jgi:large subunit ribosomal protein L24
MKIKKNDNVIVISGKDKGKKGKVLRALPSLSKVIVEGVNISKKHQRSRLSGKPGEIVSKTMPIHVSNVSLFDAKTGKPTRVSEKKVDGKVVRISKRTGEKI